MGTTTRATKGVRGVTRAPSRHWVGDGFHVRSMFTYQDGGLSPFLLLDHGAPTTFPPSSGAPRGVGEHPHRGFETVTIAYQGEIEHRDSTGSQGKIGPGDVQWMTAASGVVHEEKHGRDFTRTGGTLHMVQLWVNLPARLKMSPPKYQDLPAARIPTVDLEGGGSARVIAGQLQGAKGPASTFTPIELWDVQVAPGRTAELAVPEGHTTALLVVQGEVLVNGTRAGEESLVVLERRGVGLALEAPQGARVLLMAGEPIEEPVVGYGPFVMNTEREIRQAIQDFEAGTMGRLSRPGA